MAIGPTPAQLKKQAAAEPVRRSRKPDYIAALLGLISCSCAFFLVWAQREPDFSGPDLLSGSWNFTHTSQLTTDKSGAGKIDGSWVVTTDKPTGAAVQGFIKHPDVGERAFVVYEDLDTGFGRATIEDVAEGELGIEVIFRTANIGVAALEARAAADERRVLSGVYTAKGLGSGRVELSFTDDSAFVTVVNETSGQPFHIFSGERTIKGRVRNTLKDQALLGIMVFIVAAVINIVRGALYPKGRR